MWIFIAIALVVAVILCAIFVKSDLEKTEWAEEIGIVVEERRVPVSRNQGEPMLVLPFGLVAYFHVFGELLAFGMPDGYAQCLYTIGAGYQTTVAKCLFGKRLPLFYQRFAVAEQCLIVTNGG